MYFKKKYLRMVSSEAFHLTPLTIYVFALNHYCVKLETPPILKNRGFRQFQYCIRMISDRFVRILRPPLSA